MPQPRLFIVMTKIERSGPRGGKGRPVINQYVVLAVNADNARRVFTEELEAHADDIHGVVEAGCRTWRGA